MPLESREPKPERWRDGHAKSVGLALLRFERKRPFAGRVRKNLQMANTGKAIGDLLRIAVIEPIAEPEYFRRRAELCFCERCRSAHAIGQIGLRREIAPVKRA